MREYILACSCSGVPEKAQTSYKIMFPEREKIPEVYKGKDKIMEAEILQNLCRFFGTIQRKWKYFCIRKKGKVYSSDITFPI